MLWGMTTAPSTAMTMGSEPAGNEGTTQATAALPHETSTIVSSNRNDSPMRETKAMIHLSRRG